MTKNAGMHVQFTLNTLTGHDGKDGEKKGKHGAPSTPRGWN